MCQKKRFPIRWSKFLLNCELGYLLTIEKMRRPRIRALYEKLSEFERCRIIGLKEAVWANWGINRQMGQSNAVL
ncbi:hypothetical protein TNCV_3885411 [Trichonephila clavipes]|nr:hypothetical protein TNCV_3885411 [Trichonephila clavipes]